MVVASTLASCRLINSWNSNSHTGVLSVNDQYLVVGAGVS
jgi:hypothetical protein